jgi:hypothetical protein
LRSVCLIVLLAGCAAPPEPNFSDYQASCANNCTDRYRECVQRVTPLLGGDIANTCWRSRNECIAGCPKKSD